MVRERRSVLLRAIAVLVAGGLVTGTLSLTPALGAASFTKAKARKLFYNMKRSDSRFVNVDEAGAGPVAYAHVTADGTLDVANSKNVTVTSEGDPGYYCIDVAVPFQNVQATVDATTLKFVTARIGDPLSFCAPTVPAEATADAVVITWDNTDVQESQPFWVQFS
jgi:hypothetical protein